MKTFLLSASSLWTARGCEAQQTAAGNSANPDIIRVLIELGGEINAKHPRRLLLGCIAHCCSRAICLRSPRIEPRFPHKPGDSVPPDCFTMKMQQHVRSASAAQFLDTSFQALLSAKKTIASLSIATAFFSARSSFLNRLFSARAS